MLTPGFNNQKGINIHAICKIWCDHHFSDCGVFDYRTGRPERSHDSRAMNMQIDMHRRWIRLEWEGHPMQDQYPITEADDRVNGRLVTQVRFPGGYFRVGRNGQWREINAAGVATNRFRETGRDAWSVYLHDDSREMDMQIDVHRNWIRLAWPGHPMADQYPITWSQ